jgi:cupin 2 domain-containing protein
VSLRLQNIFNDLPDTGRPEEFLTLFENSAVKVERIVSNSHSTPSGFWYDQDEVEWVIVLRGNAMLEFESGESIEMTAGDYLTIPSRVKHRVARTGVETVWLAVYVGDSKPAKGESHDAT